MCGIFGFSGRPGRKLNLKKIKALGVYNIQRGTDSCGYYYSGNIAKGIGDESNFTTFIDKHEIVRGVLRPEIFMGHTRKSTHGSNSVDNAHPHLINDRYVQTHNGVIKNVWELCREHKIDHKSITVDSIGLGSIIEKDGFEVLKDYEGFAALSMVFTDDPGSLYLYHGASREKVGETLWEERPLWILSQPEGLYYSSLPESLRFITENKCKPKTLPHNNVYKIVDGELTHFIYPVERESKNIVKTYTYYDGYAYPNSNTYWSKTEKKWEQASPNVDLFGESCCNSPKKELPPPAKIISIDDKKRNALKTMILTENYPVERDNCDLYFRRGRYYRENNILLDGQYNIDRKGKIILEGEKSESTIEKYYFIRGIMMQTHRQFKKALEEHPDIYLNLDQNTAYVLSRYCRYPVTALETEGNKISPELSCFWYKDCKAFTGAFKPKFSSREYNIKAGILLGVARSFAEDEPFPKPEEKIPYEGDVLDGEASIQMQVIEEDVRTWAKKIITKEDDVKEISEYFLMFIDYYNAQYEKGEINDAKLEQETTIVLNDLIKLGQSFEEYLREHFDTLFLSTEKIEACFYEYSINELESVANRYQFIDFLIDGKIDFAVEDPTIDYQIDQPDNTITDAKIEKMEEERTLLKQNEISTTKDQIINLLSDLRYFEKRADDLQTLDTSDEAQNISFNMYQAIDQMKATLVAACDNENYKHLKCLIK